jgi:hypothetical protein
VKIPSGNESLCPILVFTEFVLMNGAIKSIVLIMFLTHISSLHTPNLTKTNVKFVAMLHLWRGNQTSKNRNRSCANEDRRIELSKGFIAIRSNSVSSVLELTSFSKLPLVDSIMLDRYLRLRHTQTPSVMLIGFHKDFADLFHIHL